MGLIYLGETIEKEVKDKTLLDKLVKEIKKHYSGNRNLVDLYSPGEDLKVYKVYLNSAKVRAAVLLKISKKLYVPIQ